MSEPIDPEAPYGRNPRTGEPYKRSQEERERLARNLRNGRAAQATGRVGATRAARAPKATPADPYTTTVLGLLQAPAFALSAASRFNPTLGLDALAVTLHAPNIAKAVGSLAREDARIAAVLDRVASVGPYGLLVMALSPLLLQIGANHGLIRPIPDMGVLAPDQLLEAAGVPSDNSESAPNSGQTADDVRRFAGVSAD